MDGKPGFVDRRRNARMVLRVPVRVQGHRADGTPWDEMAMTEDAEQGGAAMVMRHTLSRGHVLLLSLPLPKRFRTYDLASASYNVYAAVRNTTAKLSRRDVCERKRRSVICAGSIGGGKRSSGRYFVTGASRSSTPCWASSVQRTAVYAFVFEPL